MLPTSSFKPRRKNSGRQHDGKRFPRHLRWVRSLPCILDGRHECGGVIEAHHVNETGHGMGVKGPDFEVIPCCSTAHESIHSGVLSFQKKWGINLVEAAAEYAKRSPHRHEWENPRG
jgi:hypothetical protein